MRREMAWENERMEKEGAKIARENRVGECNIKKSEKVREK